MDNKENKTISLDFGINVFKDNLTQVINNSQLPIGIVYYVLKDVLSDIQNLYNETLNREKEEILNTLKKENKESENKEDSENKQEN